MCLLFPYRIGSSTLSVRLLYELARLYTARADLAKQHTNCAHSQQRATQNQKQERSRSVKYYKRWVEIVTLQCCTYPERRRYLSLADLYFCRPALGHES